MRNVEMTSADLECHCLLLVKGLEQIKLCGRCVLAGADSGLGSESEVWVGGKGIAGHETSEEESFLSM